MDISKNLINNSIYNVLKTALSLVFPIITFSYLTRLFGTELYGEVNFYKSLAQLIGSFSMLGISDYGMRELAKNRNDKQKKSIIVKELLCINSICLIVSLSVYIICSIVLYSKGHNLNALMIFMFIVVLTPMGLEWIIRSEEDYKYISIRTLIFQLFSLLFMFFFLRNRSDFLWFCVMSVVTTNGYNILSPFYCKKYVDYSVKGEINVRRHLRPVFLLFINVIALTVSSHIDTIMLGLLSTNDAVGLYSAASKLNIVIGSIIYGAFSVCVPRLSLYSSKTNSNDGYLRLLHSSVGLFILVAVPCFACMFFLSKEVIILFSGLEFVKASITSRILSIKVVTAPLITYLNNSVFLVNNREKDILKNSAVYIVPNIVLNLIFIPVFNENGAAISTMITEMITIIFIVVRSKEYFRKMELLPIFQIIGFSVLIFPSCLFIRSFHLNSATTIFFSVLLFMVSYLSGLLLSRNRLLKEFITLVRHFKEHGIENIDN